MKKMTTLGIMTNRIPNTGRYTHYAKEAERLGFRRTVLFTPRDIRFGTRRIDGFRYERGAWTRGVLPYPTVAHDLGYYSDARTIRSAKRFKLRSGVPFTGYALGHKWTIHSKLIQTSCAAAVPETTLLHTPGDALAAARRYGAVMVKPKNGKQGRGIVKLTYDRFVTGRPYVWQEAERPAAALSAGQAAGLLRRRFRPDDALVQRWMDIRDPAGGVFDIRALVQKDPDTDGWRLSELGVRQSGVGRIASNVSGGGAVRDVRKFLTAMYGEATAERLTEECRRIALCLPPELEKLYGKPFLEFGIDLAVERGGDVRIIEVNIKPGKKIVRALSGERAYADAVLLPIRYAKRLSDRRDCLSKGS
ncbi:YheC/YheD family protein [Paenibacillus sp. TRM 82003]|nr:YheC/YheD family protein [Paenibacillus sp. TRM 82003]